MLQLENLAKMSEKKQEQKASDWFLSDLTSIIGKKFQEKDEELIQREKDVSEREAKVKHILENEHTSKQITLRVGDRLFYSSAQILTSVKDSYFCGLLNTDFQQPKDGILFIPRDPRTFEYVLEFLTYKEVLSEVPDIGLLKKLRSDAEYYLLEELKGQTEKQIQSFQNRSVQQQPTSHTNGQIVARVSNGSSNGNGSYWSWNSASGMPSQYFQLTTRNNNNDTITVKQQGTYLINVRVTLQTQNNNSYYASLFVNGTDVARCHSGNPNAHYQSFSINEVLILNANSQLQVYSTYSNGSVNGDPYNSFSVMLC